MSDHNEIRKLSDRCSNLLRENIFLKKKIKIYDEFHRSIKDMIAENRTSKAEMEYAFSVVEQKKQVLAA